MMRDPREDEEKGRKQVDWEPQSRQRGRKKKNKFQKTERNEDQKSTSETIKHFNNNCREKSQYLSLFLSSSWKAMSFLPLLPSPLFSHPNCHISHPFILPTVSFLICMLLPPSLSYHPFAVVLFLVLFTSFILYMKRGSWKEKELWKRITLHEIKDRTNHRTICWVIAFNHKMHEISLSFAPSLSSLFPSIVRWRDMMRKNERQKGEIEWHRLKDLKECNSTLTLIIVILFSFSSWLIHSLQQTGQKFVVSQFRPFPSSPSFLWKNNEMVVEKKKMKMGLTIEMEREKGFWAKKEGMVMERKSHLRPDLLSRVSFSVLLSISFISSLVVQSTHSLDILEALLFILWNPGFEKDRIGSKLSI